MRETMVNFIIEKNKIGHTFLIVSHDMPIVQQLCQECICMSTGKVIASGNTKSVLSSPEVIEAYLGDDHV